jgi:hypothetical protein
MSDTKPLPNEPERPADPAAEAPTVSTPAHAEPVWATETPAAAPAAPAEARAETPAEARAETPAAAPAPPFRVGPPRGRWRRSRVPVLVGAAGLVLGCCLGAGIVAAGVAVFGDGHHGPDHRRVGVDRGDRDERPGGWGDRDERPGGDGRFGGGGGMPGRPGQDGNRKPRPVPTATPPAPSPAAPTPSAS